MKSLLAERERIIASSPPGSSAARLLAAVTGEAVRELARAASPLLSGRWAVVALGGWGAGELQPHSDLDILVMSEQPAARLKPFIEALLYPLWDAGLSVGHQVRSPREQLRACREDLKTCTSALTGRAIAGDERWASVTLSTCAADARRRSRRVLAELHRRARPGSPYLLEPDLKDGAGGRRDYDELTWTASILDGATRRDPSSLVRAGLLTGDEYTELSRAADVIAAARWRTHLASQTKAQTKDALSLDLADSMRDAAEEVNAALGTTSLVLARVRARVTGRSHAPVLSSDPLAASEVFALCVAGHDSSETLEHAAQAGRLDALVPGFRELMSVRRPGLGHRLTVGAHCLAAALAVEDVGDDLTLAASRAAVSDSRLVHVAALVHDAAKRDGGAGHAERGAPLAHQAARNFGLSEPEADDTAELVRLHLSLVETALASDLDDEDTVLRAAAAIGKRELVAPLHLLTAADSKATGPSTWTPWTASLVGRLVARIDAALSPDVDGAGLVSRAEQHRATAISLMGGTLDAERAFVEAAPLRYLASRDPAEVVRDARLVAALSGRSGAEQARIAVTAGIAPGTHRVTVAALDRPGLLSRIAGAMALAGLDILSVDAYGSTGGVALDSFVVTSATERPVSTDTFTALERFLEAALRDRLELATRLAERRQHYPPKAKGRCRVETHPSGWDTTVIVEAPDRPGLLHDLAAAVSATGMDIRWARAQTVGGMVRDTFHVVGEDGGPVDDPGVLGHLSMRLREAAC